MIEPETLGKTIQTLRQRKKLTQDDLADAAGIAYSTLAKIERGAIKQPSFFTVLSLAQALNINLDEITTASIQAPPPSADNKQKIQFVYFDVNGVLVRYFERAFTDIAVKSDVMPERIEEFFWRYVDDIDTGKLSLKEFNSKAAKQFELESFNWEQEYLEVIKPYKAMQACLLKVSKHYKVGLLTNISPGFIDKMLKSGDLPNLKYGAIVESSKVKAVKPAQKMFEAAEKAAGCKGRQILFIDDTPNNVDEAEKRGWRTVWFDDNAPKRTENKIYKALDL